jgi:WD40 repeat protein
MEPADVAAGAGPTAPTQLPTQQNVQSVQFDASGTLIVTVETGGLARFWNGTDGTPHGKSLALGKTTQTAALSPDGTRLITVQNTQTVSVWNMSSGRRLWEHASKVAVESAGFSHDGSRVAINYADGRLDVRAAQDGTSIASADPSPQLLITSASESVGALPIHPAFSPDDLFVAGHADGAPALFAMASGEKVRPLGDRGDALRFHFAPDGLHVLTLGVKTRLHDIRSRAPLCESLRHDAPVTDAFESPGRDVIASTVGGIYRWNVAGHTIVRQFRATAAEQAIDLPARYKPPLLAEQPSRLGEFVALRNRLNLAGTPWNLVAGNGVAWTRVAAARSATEVVVYDTASGEAVSDPIRTSATILTLQLDSSGTRVLTLGIDFASNQYVIESWEVRESTFPAQLSQQRFPRAPRVSPDASVFAADGGQRNLAIWNAGAPTSAQAKSTPGPVSNIAFDAEITAIAFDDDATAIAVGLDDGTVAVNKIGGPLVFREKLPGVAGRIRFDARRPRLAVAVDDHVFILDRRTGARLADLTLDFEATAIDFADDENTIVLAGARGLQLWSLDANAPLTPILLRDRRVNAVHFSADSQRLIASLDDGAVNVCHANGRIKASPQELAKALDQISGLAVQDDGRVRKTVTANPLASFAGKPGPPSYFERVLLWHYADRGTRTIAPLSTTRLSDHIASEVAWARGAALGDRNVQQAARAALMNAYFLDPHDNNVVAALKALDASVNAKRTAADALDTRSATPTVSASAPAALPPAEAR